MGTEQQVILKSRFDHPVQLRICLDRVLLASRTCSSALRRCASVGSAGMRVLFWLHRFGTCLSSLFSQQMGRRRSKPSQQSPRKAAFSLKDPQTACLDQYLCSYTSKRGAKPRKVPSTAGLSYSHPARALSAPLPVGPRVPAT